MDLDLTKLRQGDSDTIRAWFEQNVDGLFAFVYPRVGRDRETARDVTQTVLTKALNKLDDFDPERGSMETWLRMLSLNENRRARTQASRETTLPDEHLLKDLREADTRELPAETIARAETRELVDQTLHNLPDHYQEVLRHRYIKDASLADIAAGSNRQLSSIKPLLHRAREAFRTEFQRLVTAQST